MSALRHDACGKTMEREGETLIGTGINRESRSGRRGRRACGLMFLLQ